MKRIVIILVFVLSALFAAAQNISVKSFQALPMDMTAASLEGKRIDQNNEVAALIKIVTSQTGFNFEGGALGIVDSKQETGEVWVWVPRGSRKITIKHQQLGVLRDYRYPIEIEAERTYEMVLVTGTVETIVKEEVHEQYLMFQINPPDAVLEVNDQMWTVSPSGSASKLVNFGTYSYRVQANNYHPDAGRVTVNDPDNTTQVTVNLLPNFGWIEVGGGPLQGAMVYVDNTLIGKAPCKSGELKSGQHSVRIIKELYEPYTDMVTVTDNQTTTVNPNLTADFAHVTLQVDADAEIWVNNERKGTRQWSGDLPSGVYRIECKQTNHESTLLTKEVTNQMNGERIQLDAPRPIYGSLMVESEPAMATILIDGKEMGQTPKLIKEILIGTHRLQLTKADYADHSETITIAKGERKQVRAELTTTKRPETPKQPDNSAPPVTYQAGNGEAITQCMVNLSMYREYYKQWTKAKYDAKAVNNEMISCWRKALFECPNESQFIYVDGEKIIDHLIRSNPSNKSAYLDTLGMLMDMRAQYFPDNVKTGESQVARIKARKGFLLYTYDKNRYEEAYNALKEAANIDASQFQGAFMDAYMKTTIDMANKGKVEKKTVGNVYHQLCKALDDANKSLNEEVAQLRRSKTDAENRGDQAAASDFDNQMRKKNKNVENNNAAKTNLENLYQPFAAYDR